MCALAGKCPSTAPSLIHLSCLVSIVLSVCASLQYPSDSDSDEDSPPHYPPSPHGPTHSMLAQFDDPSSAYPGHSSAAAAAGDDTTAVRGMLFGRKKTRSEKVIAGMLAILPSPGSIIGSQTKEDGHHSNGSLGGRSHLALTIGNEMRANSVWGHARSPSTSQLEISTPRSVPHSPLQASDAHQPHSAQSHAPAIPPRPRFLSISQAIKKS
jgi:hypothetical protein